VTKLFRDGPKDEAARIIPDELIDDVAIVGDREYLQAEIGRWAASGVTMMAVRGNDAQHIQDFTRLVTSCGPAELGKTGTL
jgi:hypothetical protein